MQRFRPSHRPFATKQSARLLGSLHAALAALALLLAAVPLQAGAEAFSWASVADEAVAALDEASRHHAEGDTARSKRAITQAYFGVFEGRKMEAAMRKMLGESHTFVVERQFSNLRRSLSTAAPPEFGRAVEELAEQLRADAKQLDALGVPQEVYDAH